MQSFPQRKSDHACENNDSDYRNNFWETILGTRHKIENSVRLSRRETRFVLPPNTQIPVTNKLMPRHL